MKFIGQYIQQLIARFRNDVYLEDVSTGTIASGGNLGLDSNNKIVKATVSGGGGTASDITVADESTDTTCFPTFVTAATGDQALKTGSNLAFNSNTGQLDATIFNGTTVTASGVVTGSGGGLFNDEINLQETTNDTNGPVLNLTNTRAGNAGVDGDKNGSIFFIANNNAGTPQSTVYSSINGTIAEADDSDERGKLELKVANDGTQRNGITMTGTDTAQEVDVTIANGTSSVTTLAGTLTMGSTATLNNSGVLQVAAQPSITTLAGVFTGSANQLITDDGDGTVTSESGLTYDSSSDTLQLASTSAGFPRLEIKSNANTTSGQRLTFIKDRGAAPSDGDTLGIVRFEGEDSNQLATFYAQMFASIATAADGSEGGKITFQVASHDGEAVSALEIIDGSAEDEVDVNIASGTSSLTTIAGDLQVNGNEIKDNDGFTCITFDSSGNTIIGTLDGDNGGDLIANRVLVKDTDESPSAQLALVDNDDNNICQLARIGSGANAHKGQLVLRDNANAKVQIKASGSSYINGTSAALGIGNSSPSYTLDVTGTSNVSSNATIGGNLTISGEFLPNITAIKILPKDFIADDVGRPLMIDDTGSDRFLESHSTAKMYASVDIPAGFKAIRVDVYGSGTSAMTVYEADIDSKTVTSKGTGNIGTTLDITDVNSDSTNYLLIELAQASSEEVYGGKVTIGVI